VAFATTAPEGSVTCPRKVPVVVGDEVEDWEGDWACADAGAAKRISIAGIKIANMKTDKYLNTHLFFRGRPH